MNIRSPLYVALLVLLLTGCARFFHLNHDLRQIRFQRRIHVTVTKAPTDGNGRLVVQLSRLDRDIPRPLERVMPRRPNVEFLCDYRKPVLVLAFVDQNGDKQLQSGEPFAIRRIEAHKRTSKDEPAVHNHIQLDLKQQPADATAISLTSDEAFEGMVAPWRAGEIVTLEDERFSPELAEQGVWRPFRTLRKYGAGVFLLQKVDPQRIPIVFVHGISGTPRQFDTIIATLHPRFQPWLIHFPSGWDLEDSAQHIQMLLDDLSATHGIDRIGVVAHSMGGILAHRITALQRASENPDLIRSLVTIASPLAGVSAAELGVRYSPSVVPAWRSLTPESPLIEHLFDYPSAGISYALLLTTRDKTVSLESQDRAEAKSRATFAKELDFGHVDVLSADVASNIVRSHLQRSFTKTKTSSFTVVK